MTTVYEAEATRAILARLDRLTPASAAQWGKMDVAQMLCHVSRALRMPTGQLMVPLLPWPLRLVGRLVKARTLGDAPWSHGAPTSALLKVSEPCDFAVEKAAFLEAYRVIAAGPHVVTEPQHASPRDRARPR